MSKHVFVSHSRKDSEAAGSVEPERNKSGLLVGILSFLVLATGAGLVTGHLQLPGKTDQNSPAAKTSEPSGYKRAAHEASFQVNQPMGYAGVSPRSNEPVVPNQSNPPMPLPPPGALNSDFIPPAFDTYLHGPQPGQPVPNNQDSHMGPSPGGPL